MAEKEKKYSMIPKVTQQFRHCGNPFRIDCYKGCDFGCLYCFANSSNLLGRKGWENGDFAQLERFMKKCFETEQETNSLSMECTRHKVPFHCGGLSDPFQSREWDLHITYKLLELCNKYEYPISFSTKTAHFPEEYWKILNPKLHAFQVSLMGYDDDFVAQYETNTPSATERMNFVKQLHEKGFWVSIRIQPCVDIEQAEKLVKEMSPYCSYITVEHLKIDASNSYIAGLFRKELDSGDYRRISTMLFELNRDVKIRNIKRLKKISKCPIGCGDNDLHFMSDSDCCCGVDTMPEPFNNWIKYNLTYFSHHKDEDKNEIWAPCQDCSDCFFKGSYNKAVKLSKDITFKDHVECYCRKHKDFMGIDINMKKNLLAVVNETPEPEMEDLEDYEESDN